MKYLYLLLLLPSTVLAHHSFSAYDVYAPSIELSGVVESWSFRNPHAILRLKANSADGGCVWTMEVRNRLWNNMRLPRDAIKVGDQITVTGWPARDSSPKMIFGAFHIQGQEKVVLQTSARGNSERPTDSVVITRPKCEN